MSGVLDPRDEGQARTGQGPVWANRILLLKADEKLSDRARNWLQVVFDVDHATGKLQAALQVKQQLRRLLRTGSLADAVRMSALRIW